MKSRALTLIRRHAVDWSSVDNRLQQILVIALRLDRARVLPLIPELLPDEWMQKISPGNYFGQSTKQVGVLLPQLSHRRFRSPSLRAFEQLRQMRCQIRPKSEHLINPVGRHPGFAGGGTAVSRGNQDVGQRRQGLTLFGPQVH